MAYKKVVKDGYVLGVVICDGEGNISEREYYEITQIIKEIPTAPEGYAYRLTTDLKWELCEVPAVEEEPMTEVEQKAQAYDILMGG